MDMDNKLRGIFDDARQGSLDRAYQNRLDYGMDIQEQQTAIEQKIEDNNSFSTLWKESTIGSLFETEEERLLKAKEYSQKTGIRDDLILTDDETFKKARDLSKQVDFNTSLNHNGEQITDWARLYELYPGLEYVVKNQDNVADAAIYLKNLKNVREVQGIFDAVSSQYERGNIEDEIARLMNKKGQAATGLRTFSAEEESRLVELMEKRESYKELPANFFDAPLTYVAGATSEQLPQMIDTGKTAAKYGGVIVGSGALAGAVGGPAGAGTGAIASLPFAGKAATAGAFLSVTEAATGRKYEEYLNMVDKEGRKVFTPSEAYLYALGQGSIEGGIEVFALGKAGKIILGKAPFGVKNLVLDKVAKREIASILASGTSEEVGKQTTKAIIANGLKSYAKVVGVESAEEGVQEFASQMTDNLYTYIKENEGYDLDYNGVTDALFDSFDATLQAIPASLGLGIAGGVATSPLHAISYKHNQSRARMSEQQRDAMRNAEGQTALDRMKELQPLAELQQKSPEVARNILQSQFENVGQGSWLIDVPSLLKHEGGIEVLQKIAESQNMTSEQLNQIISSESDMQVQGAVLYQDVLNSPHEEIVRNNITLSENAPTIEQIEYENARIEEIQKLVQEDLGKESKAVTKALDSYFPEKNEQRELASSILKQNATNPMIEWVNARSEAQETYIDSLEPYLGYVESIFNTDAFDEFRKENNLPEREKLDLVDIAGRIATGELKSNMEITPEQEAIVLANKKAVDDLDQIRAGIANINASTSGITSSLTSEGVQVYNAVVERLNAAIKEVKAKEARKSIRMSAAIFARFADTYARVKRESGVEGYTAMDYFNEKIGIEIGKAEEGEVSPRGTHSIYETGKRIISLFENADASTFIHESSHEMLISLQELSEIENAPEWILKDFESVKKFVGWEEGQATWTTEQQELWATSFEAYMESGEAPTKGLKRVFRAFKDWLYDIYKEAVSQNVRATPEIEAVMTRLIASKEEIDMQLEEEKSFEESGGLKQATKNTRETYSRWKEEMEQEAQEKLLAIAMEDIKNLTPESIQEEVKKERESYQSELEQMQIWQDQALYEASGKSEFILEDLGYLGTEDFELQKEAAGGTLEQALENHIQNYEMRLKNPSLDLAFLRETAEEIVVNERYKELKDAFEYEALRKKVRSTPGTKTFKVLQNEARTISNSAKEAAKRQMRELLISQASNPKMWLRKEQTANNRMLDSLTKGNLEEALNQKSLQLTYAAMARLAIDNQKFYNTAKKKLTDRYRRINRKTNQQKMPLAERYHYNDLMFKLGFSNVRAFEPLSEIPAVADLFSEYKERGELEEAFPAWIAERMTTNHSLNANDLTMEEFTDMYNALNAIYTIGKNSDNVLTLGVSLDEVFERYQEDFNKNVPLDKRIQRNTIAEDTYNIGWGEGTQGYILSIRQPVRLIEGLGESFKDTLSFISDKSDVRETELNHKVRIRTKEIFKAYSTKELNQMYNKKVFEMPDGQKITKENLVAMALNWGNEINRDRVMVGFNITQEQVENLLRNLDARDWSFVQNIWDLKESLFPDMAKTEERMTGTVMGKVEALPFEIVDNEGNTHNLKGGYYHIAYSSKKNTGIANQEEFDAAKAFMPTNTIFGTGLGSTKKRAKQFNNPPLLLDFSVIPNHLAETIHIIAKREAVRDLKKIVFDKRFENIVTSAYGMEAYRKIQQWTRDIWGEERPSGNSAFIEKRVKKFRIASNMAIMGYRATTALLNVANIAPMMNRIGTVKALSAVASFYSNPIANYKFVIDKAAMLRDRAKNIDYTISEIDKSLPKQIPVVGETGRKVIEASFIPITFTDLILSMPLWKKVYDDTLNSEMDKKGSLEVNQAMDEKATFEANRAVRDVFGSGLAKDLAPIQKGGELAKSLTPFYSFFNAQLNVVLDGWYEGKNNGNYTNFAKSIFFNFILASVISTLARSLSELASDSEDEDDDFFGEFLKELAGTGFGGFYGARDFINMGVSFYVDGRIWGSGAPTSLYYQSAERAASFVQTAGSVWKDSGKKDMIDFGRDLNRVFNSVTGFPDTLADGFWTSLRWFDNDFQDSVWDYLRSMIFDKKLKKR